MKCEVCGTRYRGDYCPSCGAKNNVVKTNTKQQKQNERKASKSSEKPWERYNEKDFKFDEQSIDTLKIKDGTEQYEYKGKHRKWHWWMVLSAALAIALITVVGIKIYNVVADGVSPYRNGAEYTYGNGSYIAGYDIPIGDFDLTYISGSGKVYIANERNLNNIISDADEEYKNHPGLIAANTINKDNIVRISGNLKVKFSYKEKPAELKKYTFDEANRVELKTGNYIVGKDIAPGFYKVMAVSGRGEIHSTENDFGAVPEVFSETDKKSFYKVRLNGDDEIYVMGELTVVYIPFKETK